MSRRPTKWGIVGPKVLPKVAQAPLEVKQTFYALMKELEVGPYPEDRPNVAVARGTDRKHLYVAWKDGVHVMYFVTQDMPLVVLVGVHWRSGPDGGGGGRPDKDPEPEPDQPIVEGRFSLAA